MCFSQAIWNEKRAAVNGKSFPASGKTKMQLLTTENSPTAVGFRSRKKISHLENNNFYRIRRSNKCYLRAAPAPERGKVCNYQSVRFIITFCERSWRSSSSGSGNWPTDQHSSMDGSYGVFHKITTASNVINYLVFMEFTDKLLLLSVASVLSFRDGESCESYYRTKINYSKCVHRDVLNHLCSVGFLNLNIRERLVMHTYALQKYYVLLKLSENGNDGGKLKSYLVCF